MLNYILRSYLRDNLYTEAANLLSICPMPKECSHNQQARYMYYEARVKAVQLNYPEAQSFAFQALRKASQDGCLSFKLAATKLQIIAQLLMGESPERSTFEEKETKTALFPYFEVVQKMRDGDLEEFKKVVEEHRRAFEKDSNYNLILRLRHNVIKFGLRKINLSYSRISLADVTHKLGLETVEDTQQIVSKAIRDRVIEAKIDHTTKTLITGSIVDVYESN